MHYLKTIWDKWKVFSKWIATIQASLILTIFYFLFLLPLGIVFTFFQDRLGIKERTQSTWKDKERQTSTIEELQQQF